MNKRLLYVYCAIVVCITIFSQCISNGAKEHDLRGAGYAGAATCASCHKNIYDSYTSTAHYKTSRPGSSTSIKGSFTSPDNVFAYKKGLQVVMENRNNVLSQTSYYNGAPQETHPFDIAIGSGRKAQTYLYWKEDKYYQLPVSYFVPAHSWANSPGFPADHPKFDRLVPSTCFGCHSSAVALKDIKMEGLNITEAFEKNQVVYGIDCERCHGPAASHVNFHTEHPQEKKPMYITAIRSLKNVQQLDMCGICHSGLRTPQKPASAFRPGDSLSDYFYPDFTKATRATEMDVHGTQYQLFTASQCFRKSKDMNCSSCHNTHTSEQDNLQVFSQRCMNCHKEADHTFCKMKGVSAADLIANCVDCHMPALPSSKIALLTNGQTSPTPDSIRTHLITFYEDQTQKILARLRKRQ
jgi:hypothetical protein